jgi:competence protein ComEA
MCGAQARATVRFACAATEQETIMKSKFLYAFGCALLLCSIATRSAFAQVSGVVNLNTATAAELERLPRIGPARAQAILALRAKLTRFSKVEQLLRVKGIGRATFRKLRPLLALDGPTTLAKPAPL